MTKNTNLATITGQFVGRGVICERFKLADGETISLSGDHPEPTPGVEVTLSGRWALESKCMQGREFRVIPLGD